MIPLLTEGQALSGTAHAPLAHTRVPFQFTVAASFDQAVPLFGAWAERKWEPGWNPTFLFPSPPTDQEGAVFTVAHGAAHDAVWVTTAFDLIGGHVQYVVFLAHALVTRVDIHLTREGPRLTSVSVVYERTALDPSANGQVTELAQGDRAKGPAWQKAIDAYAVGLKGEAAR